MVDLFSSTFGSIFTLFQFSFSYINLFYYDTLYDWFIEEMNADGFTTLLVIVCISIGGSWYFQNDLKNQMMNHINKHDKDIVRQNDRVNMQADEIKQLKELLKEQNKKIDEQTRQITELQLKVDLHEQNFKVRYTVLCKQTFPKIKCLNSGVSH